MNPTPIAAVQYLAHNSVIEAITGTITKLYPDRKESPPGTERPWSFQRGSFRGADGHEIGIKFTDMPLLGQDWVGTPVAFMKGDDPKCKSIVVDEYNNKKTIKINPTVKTTWNPVGFVAAPAPGPPPPTAPAGPQGPAPSQHSAPPRQSPPGQSYAPPAPPPQTNRTGPMPIQGQTVGMAIKLAGDIMIAEGLEHSPGPGTAEFSKRLYQIASDIIRVSERLGNGQLAPGPSDRAKRQPAPAPPMKPPYEPDYEHQPPMNAAQRAAAENAANGYPPEHSHDRQPAFPSGGNVPMEDDDIPF